MPLLNLCSRLVVTSTLENTPIPSFGLSPFHLPFPSPRVRPRSYLELAPVCFHGNAGWPLPASPTLGGDAVGAAPPATAASPPRKAARCPEPGSCGRYQPSRAWRVDDPTSPVTLWSFPRHPEFSTTGPRLALRAAHQGCARVARPRRLPPSGPFRCHLCLRSGRHFQAATGAPTLPPWARLPTCFHARAAAR